eukprot:g11076.t1
MFAPGGGGGSGDSFGPLVVRAFDEQNPCAHHTDPNMGQENQLTDGQSVHVPQIIEHKTHRYFFQTKNTTLMHVKDQFRKLIVNLEPCKGVVYLFVRKTRPCYPNPYSCMVPPDQQLNTGDSAERLPRPDYCNFTHYLSVIDGTRDGAPTFFELPLTSTRYYIAVYYAKETSSYTLTVLTDIGAWPRPGNEGQLQVTQLQELQVQVGWDTAYYRPTGITNTMQYYVYSAMLLERDQRTNAAVFLTKKKIMNTVCGLHNNTDRPATTSAIPASRCSGGKCNATIDGVVTGKRYVFNVIAESERRYNMSYAGLILSTDWQVERRAASQQTLMAVGGLTGSIFAMVIVIYCWMISLYGKPLLAAKSKKVAGGGKDKNAKSSAAAAQTVAPGAGDVFNIYANVPDVKLLPDESYPKC